MLYTSHTYLLALGLLLSKGCASVSDGHDRPNSEAAGEFPAANQTVELFETAPYGFMTDMAARFTLPRSQFNRSLFNSIHKLWFGPIPPHVTAWNDDLTKNWFGMGASQEEKQQFDASCTATSIDALNAIGPDKWTLPKASTRAEEQQTAALLAAPFAELVAEEGQESEEARVDAALSIVLLLDQMPRNLFRTDQGKIYAHYDRISRAFLYCLRGLAEGDAPQVLLNLDDHGRYRFNVLHRIWFLMPFVHSEHIEDHDEYLKAVHYIMDGVEKRGDSDSLSALRQALPVEEKHRVIIEQFGRYPYRNKWLGRESTKEEIAWIEGGGDTFGAGS